MPVSSPKGADPDLIRRLLRAKDHMDATSHEAWTVRELARISHVSEAHFSRAFGQAFGLPPHRYLLTRRIERAKTQLRDTDQPILTIAIATGWSSLGTFGRTFRDITGQSPGEWRDSQRSARADDPRVVPPCFVAAASRPTLTTAVSEKRREECAPENGAPPTQRKRA